MWHHPKYYKELRKLRNKLDQTISQANSTRGLSGVRSGPGLKRIQTRTSSGSGSVKRQAASVPIRVASVKLQAASYKLRDS